MKLSEWLSNNQSALYDVGLFTIKPDENPAEITAGRVIFRVDTAQTRDGVVVFYKHGDGEITGELLLVEDALTEGRLVDDGSYTAEYANLAVPVTGFHPNAVITVRRADT